MPYCKELILLVTVTSIKNFSLGVNASYLYAQEIDKILR